MEYRIDDKMLNASVFLTFVNQVWPGDYDIEKTQNALSKTQNILLMTEIGLSAACVSCQMVIFLEQLQSCLCFQIIRIKELEASFSNWQRKIHRQCCILARNRELKRFMKRMVVREVYSPTS